MGISYYVRLDDACPQMNVERWSKILSILEKYSIKPLIGIIPNNKDTEIIIDSPDPIFWDKARSWGKKDYALALHGFDHVYLTENGGCNPIHKRSEFAGLSYCEQAKKIREGYKILISEDIVPKVFFAPSHTFDNTTVQALLNETNIKCISDTIAFTPYKHSGIKYIPQQMGRFRAIYIPGDWTFCFHPNIMTDNDIIEFDTFISKHRDKFCDFNDLINKDCSERRLSTKILQRFYFFLRKILR